LPSKYMSAPNNVPAEVPAEVEPGFKVFAGNLTYATNEETLRQFFSAYASDIASAQIIFHGPRSAGYGFVTFHGEDAANKACAELDSKELDGRPVIVQRAKPVEHKDRKPRRKFSKRRPKGEAGEGEAGDPANGVVEGQEGEKPRKKKLPRKKRNARPNAEGANGTADPASGAETTERVRKPRPPRRPRGEAPPGEPSKSLLFVANLAYSVDEAALTQLFTENGITVKTARVVRRQWGTPRKSKGYAFVDVGDEEQQKKALENVQGKTIADREITIKVAIDRKNFEENGENANVAAPPP